MLEELLPQSIFPSCLVITQFTEAIASFLGSALIYILPPDTDEEAIAQNETYRFIYALPIFMYAFSLVVMLTIFPYDTIKYYILTRQKDKAKEVAQQIYKIDDVEVEVFIQNMKQTCS